MSDPVRAALHEHFGFDEFLEGQEDVVRRIVGGEDLLVVMPTGAGKSLCYQLPALMRDGYSIVISPLISLMKDQVDALRARGVAAAYLNSTLSPRDRTQVCGLVAAGAVKLLYVAPERLAARDFQATVRQHPPEFLVIDEAHCISQWGHDFRPQYSRIGGWAVELGIRQICACTATATPVVRDDILTQLQRPDMALVVTGFKRPNLAFKVHHIQRKTGKVRALEQLMEPRRPTIIYASTRKAVEEIAKELGCLAYHAGLADEERSRVQNRFMSDACPIVAATNAFGMGIDRPDIRRVIHYNTPGSLESYYQEAGRAGRDGEDAECILLHSQADRFTHEFLIEMSHPPPFLVSATWDELRYLHEQHDGGLLEVTQTDLADTLKDKGCKGDQQIGACIKLLEDHGYVQRGYRRQHEGTLAITDSVDALQAAYGKPTTQRAIFAHAIAKHWGDDLLDGVQCTYAELESISGLNSDQVHRVLRALHGKEIRWTPPFAGRGIQVLRPEDSRLEIDFTEQKALLDLEFNRLDDMFRYPGAPGCRQRFLIGYFGEATDDWTCGICDHCADDQQDARRLPTAPEAALLRTVLAGVHCFGGRLGKGRIADCLAGSRSKAILDAHMDRAPCYGALRQLDATYVNRVIEALVDANCIRVDLADGRYPCVRVSALGIQVMNGDETVRVRMPDAASHTVAAPARAGGAAPSPLDVPDNDDLYDLLRRLRTKMAAASGVPAYRIFPNSTLQALANRAPVTVAEASRLKGIGDAKAHTVLPPFLEVIRAWRQQNTGR